MPNQIVSTIEQHPMMASLIIGGAGLGVALILAARKNSSGSSGTQIPYTATDAAGNPIDPLTGQALPGATISPSMSPTDLATMLQDLEQQVLNWEQTFNTSNGNSSGNNSGGSNSGGSNSSGSNNGGSSGGQTARQKLMALLTGGWGNTFDSSQTTGSWYVTPKAETTVQLAQFFGLTNGWTDISYNPHDSQFLQAAFRQHGNNTIPAGTKVWIPTSRIPGS